MDRVGEMAHGKGVPIACSLPLFIPAGGRLKKRKDGCLCHGQKMGWPRLQNTTKKPFFLIDPPTHPLMAPPFSPPFLCIVVVIVVVVVVLVFFSFSFCLLEINISMCHGVPPLLSCETFISLHLYPTLPYSALWMLWHGVSYHGTKDGMVWYEQQQKETSEWMCVCVAA